MYPVRLEMSRPPNRAERVIDSAGAPSVAYAGFSGGRRLYPWTSEDSSLTTGSSSTRSGWVRFGVPAAIFVVVAGVYALTSWDRVKAPSPHFHFVDLAHSFVSGRLDTDTPRRRRGAKPKEDDPRGYQAAIDRALTGPDDKPVGWNDWASYRVLTLKSGETVEGVWPWKDGKGEKTKEFRTLSGDRMIIDPATDVARGCDSKKPYKRCDDVRYFISFPPLPGILMIPLYEIWGYDVNDVLVTILFAALNAVLMFFLFRLLTARGYSERGLRDQLLLTALFAFGTVVYFSSVRGEVWFTALVVGLTLNIAYMMASVDARHPLLAGLMLILGFATRTPLVFATPFFLTQLLWAREDGQRPPWGRLAGKLAMFAVPCVIGGVALMWYNHARFGSPFEFGHSYLVEGTRPSIREHGLFSFWFLNRNLSAMLTNMPVFTMDKPFVHITRHGLGLIATTPMFLFLLWPKGPASSLRRSLALTIACVAVPAAFYQNTGWAQFGYRFSLDWTPYMMALLAIDRRRLGRLAIVLIAVSILVNLFGAATFGRANPFYYD